MLLEGIENYMKLTVRYLLLLGILLPLTVSADLSSSIINPPSISPGASSGGFGARVSRAVNTNYVAEADGTVTASSYTSGAVFQGFRITANGVIVARTRGNSEGHYGWHSTSASIKKGETYRVINESSRNHIIYWMPHN